MPKFIPTENSEIKDGKLCNVCMGHGKSEITAKIQLILSSKEWLSA